MLYTKLWQLYILVILIALIKIYRCMLRKHAQLKNRQILQISLAKPTAAVYTCSIDRAHKSTYTYTQSLL